MTEVDTAVPDDLSDVIQAVRRSPLFDEEWYRTKYPDVSLHDCGAAEHYVSFGAAQGYDPGPDFSTQFYFGAHPDVSEIHLNPLYHYELYGRGEDRQIHAAKEVSEIEEVLKVLGAGPDSGNGTEDQAAEPGEPVSEAKVVMNAELFDAAWYNEMFLETPLRPLEAAEHYLNFGAASGYDPGPEFSSTEYLNSNPDVRSSGVNPLYHYQMFGQAEARITHDSKYLEPIKKIAPSQSKDDRLAGSEAKRIRQDTRKIIRTTPLLDAEWYTAKYLKGDKSGDPAWLHFVKYGATRGYDPNPLFSTSWYFQEYPEIQRAGLNPLAHYVAKGAYEGYNPHPLFNTDWYLRNLDVPLDADVNALAHYLSKPDRRDGEISPSFDASWVARSVVGLGDRFATTIEAFTDPTPRRIDPETRDRILKRGIRTPDTVEAFQDDGLVFEFENLTEDLQQQLTQDAQGPDLPMLSVVMPTWNRKSEVVAAITSVLGQTYPNIELVVVDDGSTDGSHKLIAKKFKKHIASGHIKLISQENAGVCRARNTGLANTTGDFIAYLDSDNIWRPQTAELLMSALLRNGEAMSVYGAVEIFADDLEERPIMGRSFDRHALLRSNFIDLNAFAHRRELLEELGGFDENLRRLVDWELIVRYTADHDVTFLPILLVNYALADTLGNITRTVPMKENIDRVISAHRVEFYRSGVLTADQMARRYLKELTVPIVRTEPVDQPYPGLAPRVLTPPVLPMRIAIVLDEDVCAAFVGHITNEQHWFVDDVLVKCADGYKVWDPVSGDATGEAVALSQLRHTVFYWPTQPARMLTARTLQTAALAIALSQLDVALVSSGRSTPATRKEVAVQTVRDHLIVAKPQARHWLGRMELSGCVRGQVIEAEIERLGARAQVTDISALLRQPFEIKNDNRFWSRGTRAVGVPNIEFDTSTLPLVKDDRPAVLLIGMKTAMGGVERLTISLGAALKSNYHCIYLALEPISTEQGDITDQIHEAGLTLLDGSKIVTPSDRIALLSMISDVYAPEAVYVMNGSSWFVNNAAAVREAFADSVIVDQQVYDHQFGWIEHYNKPAIRRFDSFVAVNYAIKDTFLGPLGLASDKVFHIPHGIDVSRGATALETVSKAEARAEFSLPADGKIIMFAGRLTDQKRPLDFLKLAAMHRDKSDETFVLLGDGAMSKACEKAIKDENLTNVICIPFVKDINRIYRAIDALTVVSEYEGLPLVLVEAVCMGIPVVSTDVGENKRVIEEFDAGFCTAKAGDLKTISAQLDTVLAEGSEAPRPGAARARDDFSIDRMAERYARAGRLTHIKGTA
ncbi:glycosyltransferase [uncultured Tateyamaria sp.]|uniref:glycosyltransferase n=1 Tax=uncultured Tateyamaria sp. TaxID=455651 RepID=UPI00261BCDB7|nr:glycosyltransferase [uncultured Tateyamaria sp.]